MIFNRSDARGVRLERIIPINLRCLLKDLPKIALGEPL